MLIVDGPIYTHTYRLAHVKILKLEVSITLEGLERIVDLTQVEDLIIQNLDELLKFTPLKEKMPRLNKLRILKEMKADMMRRMENYRFEQIHSLQISTSAEHHNYIFDVLVCLFPRIEYLTDDICSYSNETMIRNINRFPQLTNASFHVSTSLSKKKNSTITSTDRRSIYTPCLSNGWISCIKELVVR